MDVAIKVQDQDEIKILGQLRYKNDSKENDEYIDWLRETPDRIINHIVYTHHVYLKKELPKIGPLLFSILRTHGKKHRELIEIYLLFNDLKIELENHIVKEEELIFPAMRLYESSRTNENRKNLLELINEIEGEHKAAGNIMKKIRKITNHFTLPMDACRTFELSYKKLEEIEKDIFLHIHIIKIFYLKTCAEFIGCEGFG
jgi:regulator of cell morphogenesis and NO signaling